MESLKEFGRIAGIGGIALGVLLMVFRAIIRKTNFPVLGQRHAYKVLLSLIWTTFIIAALGIAAWVYVSKHQPPDSGSKQSSDSTNIENSVGSSQSQIKCQIAGIVTDTDGNGITNANVSMIGRPLNAETTTEGHFCFIDPIMETILGLRVAKEGYKSWTENVHVPNSDIRITLSRLSAKTDPSRITQRNSRRMSIIQEELHKPRQ